MTVPVLTVRSSRVSVVGARMRGEERGDEPSGLVFGTKLPVPLLAGVAYARVAWVQCGLSGQARQESHTGERESE